MKAEFFWSWVRRKAKQDFRFLWQFLLDFLRLIKLPSARPEPSLWSSSDISLSWLGHGSVLINFFGINILTDPVLFSRVGPSIGALQIGPKRLIGPALAVNDIPELDIVLISHAHADHLDMRSIKRLRNTNIIICPKGTRDLFRGVDSSIEVCEIEWDQPREITKNCLTTTVSAFRVAHPGARWRVDGYRNCNGYLIERFGKAIVFIGDSAFMDTPMIVMGKVIEVAILPIGCYDPFTHNHCTPEEAFEMGKKMKAKRILPIHHSTFKLSNEPIHEPLTRFKVYKPNLDNRKLILRIGETFRIDRHI